MQFVLLHMMAPDACQKISFSLSGSIEYGI